MSETTYGLHAFRADYDGLCATCGFESDDGRAEHADPMTQCGKWVTFSCSTPADFPGTFLSCDVLHYRWEPCEWCDDPERCNPIKPKQAPPSPLRESGGAMSERTEP